MPVRAVIILLFAAVALMESGCGTVATIKHPSYVGGGIVYSGSRWDSQSVIEGSQRRDVFLLSLALDLPFSFVADTVALPYTIPYSLSHRSTPKKMETVDVVDIDPK